MARYLFLILALNVNMFSKVYEDLDRGALQNVTSLEFRVNGADGSGKVFYSKFDLGTAKSAFKAYMEKKGYYEAGQTDNFVSYKNGSLNTKAIFSPGEKGTAIIAVETEGEGKKEVNGDTPGRDFQDVPRPKNSKREFCLERLSGKEKSATIIYTLSGSPSACERDYVNALPVKGWIPVVSEKTTEGKELVFEKSNDWCHIFISDKTAVISVYSR